jgi:predicted dehydrogenase
MARTYARLLRQRPDCELKAVVGNSVEKTAAFAAEFGVRSYTGGDCAAMYRDNQDLDCTIITTPEWVRIPPVRAAVEARQHILLEKPFATSLTDVTALTDLLQGYQRAFGICHVLRWSPRFVAAKRVIDEGKIGDVRHIYARRHSNNQRVKRVLGRTPLEFWLAPHDIDLMRWMTGSEVVSVHATSRHRLSSADDYLIAQLKFANGVDAVLEISWCSPPLSSSTRSATFEVWGTAGHVAVDDAEMNVKVFEAANAVTAPDTYEDFEIRGLYHGIFANMIDAFVSHAAAGTMATTALADGVATVIACDMIGRSARSGQIVTRVE